jgi:hypothetical protein
VAGHGRARKTLIEHGWGTLKWLLPGRFLVRGKIKVGAEVSLAHSGYNLKRALAVVGLAKLLAALKNFRAGGGPQRGEARALGNGWPPRCRLGVAEKALAPHEQHLRVSRRLFAPLQLTTASPHKCFPAPRDFAR